jgi:hypothetical protein
VDLSALGFAHVERLQCEISELLLLCLGVRLGVCLLIAQRTDGVAVSFDVV